LKNAENTRGFVKAKESRRTESVWTPGKSVRAGAVRTALFLALIFSLSLLFSGTKTAAADTANDASDTAVSYIYDEADLLSSAQESQVNEKLKDASKRAGVPVIGVTLQEGYSSSELQLYLADSILTADFAKDASDISPDGIVYGIDMASRTDSVVTGGSAHESLSQSEIDAIREAAEERIAGADIDDSAAFVSAFEAFADKSVYYLDSSFLYRLTRHWPVDLLIAAVATAIVMIILVSMQKSKMKAAATNYADKKSIHLVGQQDVYLNTTVVHREQPKNSGGGHSGGGGSFTGSSGGSFGGSSGHF
jgi:uncharacterized protein